MSKFTNGAAVVVVVAVAVVVVVAVVGVGADVGVGVGVAVVVVVGGGGGVGVGVGVVCGGDVVGGVVVLVRVLHCHCVVRGLGLVLGRNDIVL